jgi:endonuclease YncB( thermonuclease family)
MSRERAAAWAATPGVVRPPRFPALALLLLALGAPPLRADEKPPAASLLDPALLVGTYEAGPDTVIDGDTLRLPGGLSVRVLGVDAEEVFHDEVSRRAAVADFPAYARAQRGDSPTPVKFATPEGEAAKAFVRAQVRGAPRFRLERDEAAGRDVDAFGRLLAHVFLLGPEAEVLLAEALVRAGHSPYFVKYGRCRRFDEALRAAEEEARAAPRGIWAEGGEAHYPDYPERVRWWARRAGQVDAWRGAPAAPDRVTLGVPSESDRLASLAGKPVTVFGVVERMKTDGTPRVLWLSDVKGRDLPVVFFARSPWAALDLGAVSSLFVSVRGTVTLYEGRPQIVVTRPDQVSIP